MGIIMCGFVAVLSGMVTLALGCVGMADNKNTKGDYVWAIFFIVCGVVAVLHGLGAFGK